MNPEISSILLGFKICSFRLKHTYIFYYTTSPIADIFIFHHNGVCLCGAKEWEGIRTFIFIRMNNGKYAHNTNVQHLKCLLLIWVIDLLCHYMCMFIWAFGSTWRSLWRFLWADGSGVSQCQQHSVTKLAVEVIRWELLTANPSTAGGRQRGVTLGSLQ